MSTVSVKSPGVAAQSSEEIQNALTVLCFTLVDHNSGLYINALLDVLRVSALYFESILSESNVLLRVCWH